MNLTKSSSEFVNFTESGSILIFPQKQAFSVSRQNHRKPLISGRHSVLLCTFFPSHRAIHLCYNKIQNKQSLLRGLFPLLMLAAEGAATMAKHPRNRRPFRLLRRLALAVILPVAAFAEGSLVVYTPNPDEEITYILNTFAEKYDVDVELQSMGTGVCYTRMDSEKANPQADVMFGGVETTWTHD